MLIRSLGIVLTVLLALWPAQAQPTALEDDIRAVVAAVPGVWEVVGVTITDTGDVLIEYLTAETDEIGYRAEVLEVYRAVGQALGETDLIHVVLIPGVTPEDLVERITLDTVHLLAYAEGEITRSELLDIMVAEPLNHLEGFEVTPEPEV
jgi:hypothetical protein